MKRALIALACIVFLLGLYWLWPSIDPVQPHGPRHADSEPILPTRPASVGSATPATKTEPRSSGEDTVEFPSIGKVKVSARDGTVNWNDANAKAYSLPFKFQYADNGVWVRAVYRGSGVDYAEDTPKNLEVLYAARGEKVVGIPAKAPEASLLSDILSNAHERVAFERASRIVLEHLMLNTSPDMPPEPAIMVKVWGVEKPWADSPDSIPRMRLTYFLVHRDFATVDDAL